MKKINLLATIMILTLALFTSCKNAASGGSPSTPKAFYNVGDVILTDGTKIDYDENRKNFNDFDFTTVKPVAVIFRAGESGSALGVGVRQGSELEWAKNETFGYSNIFEKIQCTPTTWLEWTNNDSWTEESDLDGSDNWDEICKIDDTATLNIDEKYPIFNYALTYGTNGDTNLIGTIYENDWFVPSIAELIEIYMNLYLLDSNVLYQLGSNANKIEHKLYHSSSQYYFDEKKCMAFDFSNKKVGTSYKIQQFFVRVVHKF